MTGWVCPVSGSLSGLPLSPSHSRTGLVVPSCRDPVAARAEGHRPDGCAGLNDLGGVSANPRGVLQRALVRVTTQRTGGQQLLKRPDVAAGSPPGQHVSGLRREPQRDRLVALRDRFLSSLGGLLPLTGGDDGPHHRDHAQQRQSGDCRRPHPAITLLRLKVVTGQLVFGLAVNRRSDRGDLLPQCGIARIPRGILTDVDEERLSRKRSRLQQHRRGGVGQGGVKTPRLLVPLQLTAGQHQQQLLAAPTFEPVANVLIHPRRRRSLRREHRDQEARTIQGPQ